jgi:hypothetical protein
MRNLPCCWINAHRTSSGSAVLYSLALGSGAAGGGCWESGPLEELVIRLHVDWIVATRGPEVGPVGSGGFSKPMVQWLMEAAAAIVRLMEEGQ